MSSKKMLWVLTLLAHALLITFSMYLIKEKISADKANLWNWGWTIISVQSLHFILSFKIVGPTELGAVLLFGRPLYQVQSGLVFVPFIVCQLTKETSLVIKERFPAEPELVDKSGDDTKPVKPGFVKPIRVATASRDMLKEFKERIEGYEDNPLNDMMTLEPSVIVRFQIRKDNFISFLTNIGSVEHAVSQMRDMVDSVLNIEFSKRTPALIIVDKEEINKELKKRIGIIVGEIANPDDPNSFNPEECWGINVIDVQLADVDLSKKINRSLRDVPDSKLRYQASIKDAEAKKKARELEGEGENKFETEKGTGVANAKLAFLKAEAEGLEEIAKVAKTEEGKLAVVAKATEQGLKGSHYSIIPDGAGSIVAGIMETLKKTKSRDADDKKDANDPDLASHMQEIFKQIKTADSADNAGKKKKGGKK